MLDNIGHQDPELRDDLIYGIVCQGIITKQISITQQKMLYDQIVNKELIINGIEQSESDTVFTRSFGLLLLALLVSQDDHAVLITDSELAKLQALTCKYLMEEKDTRGYVAEKGWAHGLAHGADLLCAIVSHPFFKSATSKQLLESIESTIFRETEKFAELEEDRLSKVISLILIIGADQHLTVSEWLQSMTERLAENPGKEQWSDDYYQAYQKFYQVIQALYFQLQVEQSPGLEQLIQQLLQIISAKYV